MDERQRERLQRSGAGQQRRRRRAASDRLLVLLLRWTGLRSAEALGLCLLKGTIEPVLEAVLGD